MRHIPVLDTETIANKVLVTKTGPAYLSRVPHTIYLKQAYKQVCKICKMKSMRSNTLACISCFSCQNMCSNSLSWFVLKGRFKQCSKTHSKRKLFNGLDHPYAFVYIVLALCWRKPQKQQNRNETALHHSCN